MNSSRPPEIPGAAVEEIDAQAVEAQLLQHPRVRAVRVLPVQGETGDRQSVVYLGADLNKRKARTPDGPVTADTDLIDRWSKLYELTYSTSAPAPSFVGWNSVYTRKPLPENEMQQWLSASLDRIRALNPRNVLEIGCGTGSLLQHLAPRCPVYVATDLSAAALARLKQWMLGREELRHVELLHRPATQLHDLTSARFDTLILNSVVQYFPDIHYLEALLRDAQRLLLPGGRIFIGDVRHLGLLPMFHCAVQMNRGSDMLTVGQLQRRVANALAQERELAIDPRFFHLLPGHLPGIAVADVQLKRGRAPHELAAYRYDVVLQTGAATPHRIACESRVWRSSAELEETVRQRTLPAVRVTAIPNARLMKARAITDLLEASDENLTLAAFRQRLDRVACEEAVDPDQLREWGTANGYEVSIGCGSDDHGAATFDAQLVDPGRSAHLPRVAREPETVNPCNLYANDPTENSVRQDLVLELREYLKARLPGRTLPVDWIVRRQLPLTPRGKLNWRAL